MENQDKLKKLLSSAVLSTAVLAGGTLLDVTPHAFAKTGKLNSAYDNHEKEKCVEGKTPNGEPCEHKCGEGACGEKEEKKAGTEGSCGAGSDDSCGN